MQDFPLLRASCRIRTNDPEITNHVLWPTELKRRSTWSGRRGSNPRPPAWKASALSTELLPRFGKTAGPVFCGHRWIRTTEGESQQIYSLPHLATLEYARQDEVKFHRIALRHDGDSHRIQTCNLLIRSQMLYSVELANQYLSLTCGR